MKTTEIDYCCPECSREFTVTYDPGTPPRRVGRFEDADPGIDPQIEPEQCPECGYLVSFEAVEYEAKTNAEYDPYYDD